jgi:hypothetical protein
MNLSIANVSSSIPEDEFDAAVAAIGRQVDEHFGPEWDASATLTSMALQIGDTKASVDAAADAVIYVGDEAEDPTTGVKNILGYHSTNHADIPYGFVYLDVCAAYHEHWTTTLSHEVLELIADPAAILIVAGPDPKVSGASVNYGLEVCDATQGDTYVIDGVEVSNFVTKAYFNMPDGLSRTTNHLGLDLEPFGVRPGGYVQYQDGSGTHQVLGEYALAHKTERDRARAMMGQGRRANRRAAALTALRQGSAPQAGRPPD